MSLSHHDDVPHDDDDDDRLKGCEKELLHALCDQINN